MDNPIHPILALDRFWAIEAAYAESALKVVELAIASGAFGVEAARGKSDAEAKPYQVSGSTAIINVAGPLTKRWTCAAWMFGGTPMDAIREQVRMAQKDDDIKSVLLLVDSPGGSVSGTSDLADDVAALNKVKPVTAYIEDMGCSAGYWIASAAGRVVCNKNATIGSIGVYYLIDDASAAYTMRGIKRHRIASGTHKGAGAGGTEITSEQLARMQAEIQSMADLFIAAVAENRGMSTEQVAELATGEVWIGAQAVELGLVDAVEPLDATLKSLQSARANPSSRRAATAGNSTTEETMSETKKVGLIETVKSWFALGVSKAEIDEALAAAQEPGGEEKDFAKVTATLQPVAGKIEPSKEAQDALERAKKAEAAAALTLANAEVKKFADAMIGEGRLTSAERSQFEALHLAALKADGGGQLALTPSGELVSGELAEAFASTAKARPAHKLFSDTVVSSKLGEADKTQSTKSYEESFEARKAKAGGNK
jgi:signal peptide peptidase SppA